MPEFVVDGFVVDEFVGSTYLSTGTCSKKFSFLSAVADFLAVN